MWSIPGISPLTVGRIVVAVLLTLLALSGSAAVTVADEVGNSGQTCPGVERTNAYAHASETAFERSAAGRATAFQAIESAQDVECEIPVTE